MFNFSYESKQLALGVRVKYPYHAEWCGHEYRRYFVEGTVLKQRNKLLDTKVRFDEAPSWEVRYTVRKWFFFKKEVVKKHRLEIKKWVNSHYLQRI